MSILSYLRIIFIRSHNGVTVNIKLKLLIIVDQHAVVNISLDPVNRVSQVGQGVDQVLSTLH